MCIESLRTGYATCTDRIVNIYDTLEEAQAHIKYQKEIMHSPKSWSIAKLQVKWIPVEQTSGESLK